MATTLSASLSVSLNAALTDAGTLSSLIDRVQTGVSGMDEIAKALTTGTGADQGNKIYYNEATIAAGANADIDLTALTDRKGVALSFAKVRWVIIVLDAPAASYKLIFKGSTATNPWTAWKGAAANDEDIPDVLIRTNNKDGWTVSGTDKVLRLNNPSAGSVTYRIVLVGNS